MARDREIQFTTFKIFVPLVAVNWMGGFYFEGMFILFEIISL